MDPDPPLDRPNINSLSEAPCPILCRPDHQKIEADDDAAVSDGFDNGGPSACTIRHDHLSFRSPQSPVSVTRSQSFLRSGDFVLNRAALSWPCNRYRRSDFGRFGRLLKPGKSTNRRTDAYLGAHGQLALMLHNGIFEIERWARVPTRRAEACATKSYIMDRKHNSQGGKEK